MTLEIAIAGPTAVPLALAVNSKPTSFTFFIKRGFTIYESQFESSLCKAPHLCKTRLEHMKIKPIQ